MLGFKVSVLHSPEREPFSTGAYLISDTAGWTPFLPFLTTAVDAEGRALPEFSAIRGGKWVTLTGVVMDVKAAVIVSGHAVAALGMSGLVGFGKSMCMTCGFLGRCAVDNRPGAVPIFLCMAV